MGNTDMCLINYCSEEASITQPFPIHTGHCGVHLILRRVILDIRRGQYSVQQRDNQVPAVILLLQDENLDKFLGLLVPGVKTTLHTDTVYSVSLSIEFYCNEVRHEYTQSSNIRLFIMHSDAYCVRRILRSARKTKISNAL